MNPSSVPTATYRLQFSPTFTFDHAIKVVPYLGALGVSHVYASPIQMARPGSTHGYDIVDHTRINPELGGEIAFERFSKCLTAAGLKLLLDIVPNHMGVGGGDNPWWLSVLEWGELSPHAAAFDIDWERPGAQGKLVTPFLGKPYGAALHAGELKLRYDEDCGAFSLMHWDHKFPINPLDYAFILEWAQVAGGGGPSMRPLYQITAELRKLVELPRPVTREGRVERCEHLKRSLSAEISASRLVRDAIDKAVSFVNGSKNTPESFGALNRLIQRQAYRLAFWRVASAETNYRRFFDINALAGLRVEEESVFEATHKLIFDLVEKGHVHGLRIDHVDGLAGPAAYLKALRSRVGQDVYIVVEKILGADESLPSWPIAGTTGYEAMRRLDSVFMNRAAESAFDGLYEASVGRQEPFETQIKDTKTELLRNSFRSELETLVFDIKQAADQDILRSDFTLESLRRALAEVIACLPVYRTYIAEGIAGPIDRQLIQTALYKAKTETSLDTTLAHDLLESILLPGVDANRSPFLQTLLDRIIRRFQQITGPIMAKSIEDTLFYRHARFIALNEVGNDPHIFGIDASDFHEFCAARAQDWPDALTATATHDTKRGEDVRARLLALSHRPQIWRIISEAQQKIGASRPDANDRYMLLQTIVGAWPVEGKEYDILATNETFSQRIIGYAIKAVRESKRHSSWTAVNEQYESCVSEWLRSLVASEDFCHALGASLREFADAGARIMISRLVLKLTMPGVPDVYQGCEFEDFSLVDPDNRREVDYNAREKALGAKPTDWSTLKAHIIRTILGDRAQYPLLYARGSYEAVTCRNKKLLCFRRKHDNEEMLVAVWLDPFCTHDLMDEISPMIGDELWSNLLGGHALEQRKPGGQTLPAVVLRKSS